MAEIGRPRHTRGLVSAIITYLLRAGWDPISATEWDMSNDATKNRQCWNFHSADFFAMDQAVPLINEFVDSLALKQWGTAAEHLDGRG